MGTTQRSGSRFRVVLVALAVVVVAVVGGRLVSHGERKPSTVSKTIKLDGHQLWVEVTWDGYRMKAVESVAIKNQAKIRSGVQQGSGWQHGPIPVRAGDVVEVLGTQRENGKLRCKIYDHEAIFVPLIEAERDTGGVVKCRVVVVAE